MEKEMKYQKNLSWNMLIEEGKLFITKGGDEIYYIDGIDENKSKLLFDAYQNNKLDDAYFQECQLQEKVKELETAGVIYKGVSPEKLSITNLDVCFKWFGHENSKTKDILKEFINNQSGISIVEDMAAADFLIIIRSSGKMMDVMKDYEKINIPHIFIDLAYDHIISIGPIVFPGETACLGCFIGRITRNWGDALPPEIPNIHKSHELIASFILEYIKTYRSFGNCPELINQVWTFNLNDFQSKYDKVFRLPWCPICYSDVNTEGTGSFELPWKMSK